MRRSANAQMNSEQELEPEELEDVAGGVASYARSVRNNNRTTLMDKAKRTYCNSDINGPKHDYVREGHYEVPYLKYWSKGYDVLKCKRCGFVWHKRDSWLMD